MTLIPTLSPHRGVFILCMVIIGLSVLPFPYAFYFFLRIIIFGAILWLVLKEYGVNSRFFVSGLGFFGVFGLILYNPLMPVHLGSKVIWFGLNIAGLVLIRVLMERDKKRLDR